MATYEIHVHMLSVLLHQNSSFSSWRVSNLTPYRCPKIVSWNRNDNSAYRTYCPRWALFSSPIELELTHSGKYIPGDGGTWPASPVSFDRSTFRCHTHPWCTPARLDSTCLPNPILKHTPAFSYLYTSSTVPLASLVLGSPRPHDRDMDTHSQLFIISSRHQHHSNWLPTFVRIIKVHRIQSNHCHVSRNNFNRIIGPTLKHLALSKGHKWAPDAVVDRSDHPLSPSKRDLFAYDAKPSVILLGPKSSTYQFLWFFLSC